MHHPSDGVVLHLIKLLPPFGFSAPFRCGCGAFVEHIKSAVFDRELALLGPEDHPRDKGRRVALTSAPANAQRGNPAMFTNHKNVSP